MKILAKLKMKRNNIILLFSIIANNLIAQQFNKSAILSKIDIDGLHAISLTPEIRSFSNIDLNDLRIYDAGNKEVPYYIWKFTKNTPSINFEEFPIISKEILTKKASNIIVEVKGKNETNEIVLNITNSKLLKFCNISGSNDQRHWFGLLDNFKLSDLENISSTSIFVNIKLPKTNYKYLKFQINDTKTAPIDILKIGQYKHSLLRNKLLSINPTSLKYINVINQKKTQIVVNFKEPQILESLDFEIFKPNFYRRNARILAKKTILKKHNKKETFLESLTEFELNSNKSNSIELPTIFEKEIIIEIDNEDNPTLEITKINFKQTPIFIIADLKASANYTLKTGNSILNSPNYDIYNFKEDSISTLPTVSIGELKTINNQSLTQNENTSFWQNKIFLWLCIGLVGLIIFYFSSTLIKDMK